VVAQEETEMASSTVSSSKSTKSEPIQFTGLTPAEQKLITAAQSKIKEVEQVQKTVLSLSVEAGHFLYDARALGRNDRNRYAVTLDSKLQNVGRFDAVINSVGIARATAYRYIRAYERHLQTINPVAANVIQMATSNGVLDVTTEVAQEALAEAFLAAGQPSNPTPQECMAIVADACERAAQTPVDTVAEFKALLSKALTFATENHLPVSAINAELNEVFSTAAGWTPEEQNGKVVGWSASL
jgi:hypothetical protein